jgi:Tol biopolymer transport system component
MGQSTTLLSRNSAGDIADAAGCITTGLPAISGDGNHVVFVSFIPDLAPGGAPEFGGVYLHDRVSAETIRIAVSSTGGDTDGISGIDPEEFDGSMGVSFTGRYVVFPSAATNLIVGDTNGVTDIFIRDTLLGVNERVSLQTAGGESNGKSVHCAISPSVDGRFVVFNSDADNLVAGDTNGQRDIFIRDRTANITERVSIGTGGEESDAECVNPSVTADGRFVVFTSEATTLDPVAAEPGRKIFLRDRLLNQTFFVAVSATASGIQRSHTPETAAVSNDGRFVAFRINDDLGPQGAYVRDRQNGTLELVGVNEAGQTLAVDNAASISADGRFVGFTSNGINGGAHCRFQAYVRDRLLQTTAVVSVSESGGQGDGDASDHCLLSADGRVAAYSNGSHNLVAGDTNGRQDIFVHDLDTEDTIRASVSSSGFQGTAPLCLSSGVVAMTPDASRFVFLSGSANLAPCGFDGAQVYVRVPGSGLTELISVTIDGHGGATSDSGAISDNGRYVAFTSESNRIVEDDTNGARDIFLRDRLLQTTTRISVTSAGEQHNGVGFTDAPSISGDGRYIVFHSDAPNLDYPDSAEFCPPGSYAQCPYLPGVCDTQCPYLEEDVFVRDVIAETTTILSTTTDGGFEAVISGDGAFVAYTSGGDDEIPGHYNGRDIYIVPRAGGAAVRVGVADNGSRGTGDKEHAAISGNGSQVAFLSWDEALVPDDHNSAPDIYVRDLAAGTTTRVSIASDGTEANGPSLGYPVISRNGRYVAFSSDASNLVADDTNGVTDAFMHDRATGRTIRVSLGDSGAQGDAGTVGEFPSLGGVTSDGRWVAFSSYASNLVPGDTNRATDAFLRDTLVPPAECPGDANGNGTVAFSDITSVLENWGALFPGSTGPGDANHNGTVNFADITSVLENWGSQCAANR